MWLLGAWAPALAVSPPTYGDLSGLVGVLIGAAALAAALRWMVRRSWMSLALVAGALALGAALTVPRVGRAPIGIAWLLVALGHAALVAWRSPIGSPRRPTDQAWLGVPFVIAAAVVWQATTSLIATLALIMAGFGVVEWCSRAPAVAEAIDQRVNAVSAGMRRRLFGSMGVTSVVRYAGAQRRDLGRWIRTPKTSRDRWFVGALGTGFALRAVWVAAMSESHAEFYSEWNFMFARQFASGQMPSYGGIPTAYWPPGYGATIAPLQWLSNRWPWLEMHMAASGLNVIMGTVTIGLVGALAARWFGPTARNIAAWIMALAVGHIYATSAGVGETLATMVFVLVVLASTVIVDRAPASGAAPFVVVGLLIGYISLVKDFGPVLVLVPALVIRARRFSWKGALRPVVASVLGALVLLGPWTVRNGVQVGVWRPTSTVSSDTLCYARWKLDWTRFEAEGVDSVSREVIEDCNRNSPVDNPDVDDPYALTPDKFRYDHPDEPKWVSYQTREFLEFLADEPLYLFKVAPLRIYETVGNDANGGLSLANESGEVKIAGPLAMKVYGDAANAWYYAVLTLALVALARLRKVRAAIPLWAMTVFLALYTIPGPRALSRHFFIAYPFLTIMASAAIVVLGGGSIAVRGAGSVSSPANEDAQPADDRTSKHESGA